MVANFKYNCNHSFNAGYFKQTIRSSGSNLTPRHIEDVSLAVLFLMEAARKADTFFGATKH